MSRVALPLQIDTPTRQTLEKFVHSSSTPQSLAMRSRIILAAGDGSEQPADRGRAEDSGGYGGKMAAIVCHDGLEGLRDSPRSGRPRRHDSDTRHKVQTRVCQQPEDQGPLDRAHARRRSRTASQHGTCHAGCAKLQPHRVRTFTFSPDPDFEAKLLDIVGCISIPRRMRWCFCVDEKTGIQALNRTQPGLPLRTKKPRAWTNEYVRHGTQTLLAALEIATGKVVAHVRDRRTTVDFLSFMDDVVKAYPVNELCVVLDNLNIHKNEAAKQWLLSHPRVHFHYTPTHASWNEYGRMLSSVFSPGRP